MESVGEPSGRHKAPFMFPFAGVVLSVAGVLLLAPVLTISPKCSDKFFIFIPVYASLLLLITLNFYLNMLSLLLHATACACSLEPPSHAFVMRHLPRAARAVTLTTLVVIAPLSIHVAVAKESIGMAIGAAFVCLASVTILASVFAKLLIFRGFAPPLFALCICTVFLVVSDPILFFTHKNHCDLLNYYPPHPNSFSLMFVSFLVFILSIMLLLLRIGAPELAYRQHTTIYVENLVVGALSVLIATLLLGGYIKVYRVLTDMEPGGVGAVGI